jgi:cobalt-zinc-cadmium efflux system protein
MTGRRSPNGGMTRSGRLVVALALNAALVVGQVAAGLVAHSTGLVADAGHNLADAVAVGASLLAVRWALRPRSEARSFGNHRSTILAAMSNAGLLAVVTVVIMIVSVYRLVHPVAVDGSLVAAVAGAAVVVNGLAALVLVERERDLNMRSALVHMTSDVAAAFCVLVAGVVIAVTGGGGWDRIDPVASLAVALLIVVQAFGLMKASVDVLLESTPSDVDLAVLRRTITDVRGVEEVHDLHVWSLSSDVRALSAHLVMAGHPTLEEAQAVGEQVRAEVVVPFGIAHTTFEMECERCAGTPGDPCDIDGAQSGGDGRRPIRARTREDPE